MSRPWAGHATGSRRSGDLGIAAKARCSPASATGTRGQRRGSRWPPSRGPRACSSSAEPSPTVASSPARLAINAMLRGEFDETIELCERALAIADDLDLDDIRCPCAEHARRRAGQPPWRSRRPRRPRTSIEIAERINAAEAIIRGYKNLGSTVAELGELGRAAELERRGADAARRFGTDFQLVWFETELAILAYLVGRLGRRRRGVRPPRRVGRARSARTTWRRRHRAAARRCERLAATGRCAGRHRGRLDFARRSREPQVLLPALADAALIVATPGGSDAALQVAHLFEELAAARAGGAEGGYWTVAAALALVLSDQPELFAGIVVDGRSLWVEPARLLVTGEFRQAADLLATIGARPMEAFARLLEARSSISKGHRAEGEAELQRAMDFWSSVRATRHCATAEALLIRTA